MSSISVNNIDKQSIRGIKTNRWISIFEVRTSRIQSYNEQIWKRIKYEKWIFTSDSSKTIDSSTSITRDLTTEWVSNNMKISCTCTMIRNEIIDEKSDFSTDNLSIGSRFFIWKTIAFRPIDKNNVYIFLQQKWSMFMWSSFVFSLSIHHVRHREWHFSYRSTIVCSWHPKIHEQWILLVDWHSSHLMMCIGWFQYAFYVLIVCISRMSFRSNPAKLNSTMINMHLQTTRTYAIR